MRLNAEKKGEMKERGEIKTRVKLQDVRTVRRQE